MRKKDYESAFYKNCDRKEWSARIGMEFPFGNSIGFRDPHLGLM